VNRSLTIIPTDVGPDLNRMWSYYFTHFTYSRFVELEGWTKDVDDDRETT